ncbi:hypothetical protein VCHA53O466_140180 [Vibrio chagasii]|nr:hypothetical protein VCHA53O466_140180 [Vibrio chagasii]
MSDIKYSKDFIDEIYEHVNQASLAINKRPIGEPSLGLYTSEALANKYTSFAIVAGIVMVGGQMGVLNQVTGQELLALLDPANLPSLGLNKESVEAVTEALQTDSSLTHHAIDKLKSVADSTLDSLADTFSIIHPEDGGYGSALTTGLCVAIGVQSVKRYEQIKDSKYISKLFFGDAKRGKKKATLNTLDKELRKENGAKLISSKKKKEQATAKTKSIIESSLLSRSSSEIKSSLMSILSSDIELFHKASSLSFEGDKGLNSLDLYINIHKDSFKEILIDAINTRADVKTIRGVSTKLIDSIQMKERSLKSLPFCEMLVTNDIDEDTIERLLTEQPDTEKYSLIKEAILELSGSEAVSMACIDDKRLLQNACKLGEMNHGYEPDNVIESSNSFMSKMISQAEQRVATKNTVEFEDKSQMNLDFIEKSPVTPKRLAM